MQIFFQNRATGRFMMLAFFAISIIIITWRLAPADNVSSLLDHADAFMSRYIMRSGASTDSQIQLLQQRLQTNSNDWQAYTELGLVYLQKARETGDPAYYLKTDEALDKALALQQDDYASLSAKGMLALARHDFHAALDWGERAKQINPDRPYAYGVIADAQVELGQYSDAVETLQAMMDLRPDMSSYSRVSYFRELHGDTAGALEMMQLAVDGGIPGSENTAWVRTQLASLYFNIGDIEQAEIEYQRTLRDRADYVYALAGLGRIRAAQDDMEEAIRLLNRAVTIMPMPEFVITLGDLYQATGRKDAANQQYQLVATIEKLYRANGVDMDLEIALFNADHDQNLDETVALARKAYANRPSIQAADALAWVLYKAGSYEEAQKYSDEALQLGTRDALKFFHAGMIALQLGENAQAQKYIEQTVALNPHFSILYSDEAQRTLKTLQSPGNNHRVPHN